MNKIYLIGFFTLCTFALCTARKAARSSESEEDIQSCQCPHHSDPACGNDGKTYTNLCLLKCEVRNNHKLKQVVCPRTHTVAGFGPIKFYSENAPENWVRACKCGTEYDLRCASDGEKYENLCLLKCAQKDNPKLKTTPCADAVDSAEKRARICRCSDEFDPICGSDDNTYTNKCRFKCAVKLNLGLVVKSHGSCHLFSATGRLLNNDKHADQCKCNPGHTPVCGTDGRTYDSWCLLYCDQLDNPLLKVANHGPCKPRGRGHFHSSEEHPPRPSKPRPSQHSKEDESEEERPKASSSKARSQFSISGRRFYDQEPGYSGRSLSSRGRGWP